MSIYLKKVNYEDIDKEYEAIINIPENENGLVNKYYNVTKEEFKNKVIPELLNHAKGIDLSLGHVPDTYFFLWDDNEIVGLFKIRHYLVESLIKGAGHIGYAILKKYRGKGYATAGLKAAIEVCKDLIKEDEIYLSSHKDNPASLKVQIKCGAYLTGENENEYFTRIKLNNEKELHFGIRDLKRDDWSRIIDKTVNVINYKNEYFDGKICLLKMNNVSSPKPLLINDDIYLSLDYENNHYDICVFEYVNGKNYFEIGDNPSSDVIRELARQIVLINNLDIKPEFIYDAWAIINFEKEYSQKREYLSDKYKEEFDQLLIELKSIDFDKLPKGFVHGDIISTNVMIDNNSKIWILDFAVSNYLPRIIDLAVTSCNICLDKNSKDKTYESIALLLGEYNKYNKLTDYELEVFGIFYKLANAMHILQPTYIINTDGDSEENQYWLNEGIVGYSYSNDDRLSKII